MKLYVMSCCFNEENILPFYLDYYTNFIKVDKIIIYDGGSTDNTPNIIKNYPNVDFIIDKREKMDERNLTDIRNNGWLKYRDECDWIIVCDIDEFIYHPNLKKLLSNYDNNDITIAKVNGYDMISNEFPMFQKGYFLPSFIKNGIPDPIWLNKSIVFNSQKIINMNYGYGTHNCSPIGDVKYSQDSDIKLLQYKWLSYDYVTKKSLKSSQRLSDWNLDNNMAFHYDQFSKIKLEDFNRKLNSSIEIITDFPNENVKKESKNKICVSTMCYNEVEILPFWLDYYVNFIGVDKIIFFDGGSDDGTQELIRQCPIADLIVEKNDKLDTRCGINIQNNGWKKYKDDYDWMIVCDMDEFLYHPNLKEKLMEYKEQGITIPLIEGFDMISMDYPIFETGKFIHQKIKSGIKDSEYLNKFAIFNPKKVDINYRMGCHRCDPIGDIKFSGEEEIKLLQYKWLSYEHLTEQSRKKYERLSDWNLEHRAGFHYKVYSETPLKDYIDRFNCSINVVDNKIIFNADNYIGNEEELKIQRLGFLEYFMRNEKLIPYSQVVNFIENDEMIISYYRYINILHNSDKSKNLITHLLNIGYEKINDYTFRKKKEKDIYIFSHNYLINNWKDILENQLNKMSDSGLYKNSTKLFFFAFGDDEQWSLFEQVIETYDIDNKIEIKRFDDNFYEYHTLQHLWDFCQNINESYILYFHLKGVWSSDNLQINNQDEYDSNAPLRNPFAIEKWRDCLEYFNIERWYECVEKLKDKYEVVGALYNYNTECPIFTGNFWWTNSNYVQKLEYPIFEKEKEPYDVKLWIRIKCEKWINSIPNVFYNFFIPKDLGVYHIPILPEEYRDDINPLISILTPTYKRYHELRNVIECVIQQTYTNWEMLICSDGFDEKTKNIVENFESDKIKYVQTNQTNDHGASQRNYLTKIAKGKYIIYLDDDNIIYPNHLQKVVDNIDRKTGMIIYRIDYDGLDYCLPIEDKIILGKIDTLNFVVDKYYTKYAIWNNYIEHDYEVIKICENNILNHNKNIKFIPDVLGRHIDKSKNNKYSFITPTYKRYKTLKRCIDSVIQQNYTNWEMLICSDGDDNKVKNIIESYNDNRIKYFYTEQTNFFGTHQRNFLINKTNGNYIIFLDDDNYLYSNHLKTINENINNSDMLIYRIDFENYEYKVIPLENKIEHRKIDSLNFVIKKDLSTRYKWKKIYEHDYLYFKSIEADIAEENRTIKYIPDILAIHTDKSRIDESDDIVIENFIDKPVVIMTAHPNYKLSEDITKEAISSFGDKDIILSTHCPVSVDLQKMVKYFLYDKNNPLIRHDYYEKSWFNTDKYHALIKLHYNNNDYQHALAVYVNYYNAIIYAKSLGYTTAICTNFDIVFSKEDINIIEDKIKEMKQTGKESFYMTSNANEGIHYKTIFFITDVDFFLQNFKYVTNEKDYNILTREVGSETNCLENFFYQTLKNSDKLLLQQINEGELFSTSKVNLFSNIEYFTILPMKNNNDNFIIWFSSANSIDNRFISIHVLKNGEDIFSHTDKIDKDYRFYKEIKFEKDCNYEVICKVYYDDVVNEKSIIVNNDIFYNKLKDYGEFWENQ